MAHFVVIEDDEQQLVDVHYYCSDFCAKSDPAYAGWFGAQELQGCEPCAGCGVRIEGYAHGDVDADSFCR